MRLSLPEALEAVDKNTQEDDKGRHVWCLVVAVGLAITRFLPVQTLPPSCRNSRVPCPSIPGHSTQPRLGSETHTELIRGYPWDWETWVLSLGWEDPLEEGMETLSSILAWRIPWTEAHGGLQSTGSQSQTRLSS